jgi:formylglycine-generating enzyme required for sulfatase activity
MDPSVIGELVKRLEAKLLPVPGTGVLMSKTEMTVGEWKLYLRAEGYPDWQQPSKDFKQNDEHPVVGVGWNRAKQLCEWLSKATGKEWRLPKNLEWEAAAGNAIYPWGSYYPPKWYDGNYSVPEDGKAGPSQTGVDGFRGTAPVGSFHANALGFYDIGGNVWEWMWDGTGQEMEVKVVRGGGWYNCGAAGDCRVSTHGRPVHPEISRGLRLVRSSNP